MANTLAVIANRLAVGSPEITATGEIFIYWGKRGFALEATRFEPLLSLLKRASMAAMSSDFNCWISFTGGTGGGWSGKSVLDWILEQLGLVSPN